MRRGIGQREMERAKEQRDRAHEGVMESDGAERAKEGKGWRKEWRGWGGE